MSTPFHTTRDDASGRAAFRLDQIAAIEMDSGLDTIVHLTGGQSIKLLGREADTDGLWDEWMDFLEPPRRWRKPEQP